MKVLRIGFADSIALGAVGVTVDEGTRVDSAGLV